VKVTLIEEEVKGKKRVSVTNDDAIAKEMTKLLKELNIKRPGLNFYGLRHGFQTVAEERAGDPAAIRCVMGHADESGDMSAHYREGIADDRLRKVAEAVRGWLIPIPPGPSQVEPEEEEPDIVKFPGERVSGKGKEAMIR
jgi:hypothetical protein